MSVREYPSVDSKTRHERATNCNIIDVRTISGDTFAVLDEFTVYEVDLINEQGSARDNVTIIPRILFENTKDVQYRHEKGIIGKYSLALAQESDEAREELLAGIREKRQELRDKSKELDSKDSRLLHTEVELGGL